MISSSARTNGRKTGEVLVVVAMDTEGPIDDPRKPEILSTWNRVHGLIDRLFSEEYRRDVVDSMGHGPVISWFILTLTGFKTNPFKRAMGHHAIYDYYKTHFDSAMAPHGDEFYWHYHHPAPSGVGNEWCADWIHCQEYDDILGRYVLEREFFPSCYRAGGRIETNDTSWWLEELFPFDYSSCSGNVNWDNRESDGKLLREVCDWSRAPKGWAPYHPDAEDYQSIGRQARWMFRCPDLDSPVHRLSVDDVRQAFEEARAGQTVVLSFFEHDRRDISFDKLMKGNRMIRDVAATYPDITWKFSNAREAALAATGTPNSPAPGFTLDVLENGRHLIEADAPIFGRAPFVVTLNATGDVRRISPLVVGRRKWLVDLSPSVRRIGIAANSPSGDAGVMTVSTAFVPQHLIGESA